MKINELENAPQWLKDAQVSYEDVVIEDGLVIWKDGIWKDGIWEGGIWEAGIWKSGIWERGIWKDGTWERGTWERGIWERGIWERGIWEGGIWERGIWERGTWEDGIWKDGIWKDGIWKDGIEHSHRCFYRVGVDHLHKKIKFGCQIKTVDEWAEIAKMETYNNLPTPQFERLKVVFYRIKAMLDLEN